METPYMLMISGNLHFLIKMEWIETVVPRREKRDGEIPVFLLSNLCGLDGRGEENDYVLILNSGGGRFGIAVHLAEGLKDVREEDKLPLAEEARRRENRYLESVVSLKRELCPLAYCLNAAELYEKALNQEPDDWI